MKVPLTCFRGLTKFMQLKCPFSDPIKETKVPAPHTNHMSNFLVEIRRSEPPRTPVQRPPTRPHSPTYGSQRPYPSQVQSLSRSPPGSPPRSTDHPPFPTLLESPCQVVAPPKPLCNEVAKPVFSRSCKESPCATIVLPSFHEILNNCPAQDVSRNGARKGDPCPYFFTPMKGLGMKTACL
jgi:hypothetical protein